MAKTNFAPWSAETAQGIKTDPVDSNIKVKQEVIPAISVGTVNALTGEWTGVRESDTDFLIDPTHEAVANGATVLCPQRSNHEYIDMTGYQDLFIALKTSTGGNFAITAVMGPNTYNFANLYPVDAASVLRGASLPQNATADFQPLLEDAAQTANTNVWTIFILQGVLAEQKNLQFKIVNNTGTQVDLQFASLRVV